MPKVFEEDGRKYFFYSNEGDPREPMHVHVRSGHGEAKIWLRPEVRIAAAYGFNSREQLELLRTARRRRDEIERAWHAWFS
jgi:hypothetical protein